MTTCAVCNLPGQHGDFSECADALLGLTNALLRNAGDKGTCAGCGAEIYWMRHKNGKRVPYTPRGLNHFIDCPKAGQFRKKES